MSQPRRSPTPLALTLSVDNAFLAMAGGKGPELKATMETLS